MTGNKRKVLLAEHDEKVIEILSYLLKAWDYSIVTVLDGRSVLDIVRREQPDIIIIDSNLPKLDGLSVSKSLKEDFLTAHIPVIILIDKRQIRKKMLEIEQGVDDYLANPPDPIDLEVRMEMALRRATHQLHANALTRLPGNRQIEKVIHAKFNEGVFFSVAYYDIDNFKCFNDKYGYMKGDSVIKHAAYIISRTVKQFGNKTDLVGHIGGDDFVVVTTPEREKIIASESILSFNRLTPFHYTKEDRERKYIVAKDRKGIISKIPLMSLSIAIANNKEFKFQSIVQFMETIAEIKKHLKTLPGSNFLVNRRDPTTKREFMKKLEAGDSQGQSVDKPKFKYRPLGQILVDLEILTALQLEEALNRHWSTGQKIGQCIVDLGMGYSSDIAKALEFQLKIPHFDIKDLDKNGDTKELIDKVSFDLMKESSIIPVGINNDIVSLVMLDPKDLDTIEKVKAFTGYQVSPFFVLESEFSEIWKRVIKKADKG